jgi:hypothetical protein
MHVVILLILTYDIHRCGYACVLMTPVVHISVLLFLKKKFVLDAGKKIHYHKGTSKKKGL